MPPISTLSGLHSEFPSALTEALARYRHQIFIERLGWPLPASNGKETDQFDRPDTIYVLARDADGALCGCARLLPTSGPYLLRDVFPAMMGGEPLPCSSSIWELSRFASTSRAATRRLLTAVVARAAQEGARRLIMISPLGVERLLQRMGVRTARAGEPVMSDGQTIFACWLDIDAHTCAALGLEAHAGMARAGAIP